MKHLVFFLSSALLIGWQGVMADTATLNPVADAEIHEFNGTANFGSLDSMVSGKLGDNSGGERRRALLRFDVSQIPANATVSSVTLALVVSKTPPDQADSNFDLRRVLQSWTESGVSWNGRSSVITPWSSPGAGGSGDISGAVSSSVFVSGNGNYTFASTANLVADVQAWIQTSSSNFGWLLISEDEVSLKTARHFGSRESGSDTPILTVTYSVVTAANPPTLNNVAKINTQFSFNFNAEANRSYTVESLSSLTATNWGTVTTFNAASVATNHTVTDTISGTAKFYRVKTP